MIGVVVIITLIVILLIIAGILSISIGSMLRQKKEEHAIYKALGYTTKELMIQVSLSLVIVSFIGAAFGGILTFCLSNIMLRSFFSYFGMSKINLVNSPFVLIIMGIFIVAFVFKVYKLIALPIFTFISAKDESRVIFFKIVSHNKRLLNS